MRCPYCGDTHSPELDFCPNTGKPLYVCQHCGEKLLAGVRFCPFCGKEQTGTKKRSPFPFFIGGMIGLLIILAVIAMFVLFQLFSKQPAKAAPLVFPPVSTLSFTQVTPSATSDNVIPTLQLLPFTTPLGEDTPTTTWQPNITTTPEISSLATLPAVYDCPDKDQIFLRIGATGMVQKYDVNLRKEPVVPKDYFANVIKRLRDGDKVTVLDGPTCAYYGSWWKVQTELNDIGWVREIQPGLGKLILLVQP